MKGSDVTAANSGKSITAGKWSYRSTGKNQESLPESDSHWLLVLWVRTPEAQALMGGSESISDFMVQTYPLDLKPLSV